jgi:hypothetical protein
VGGREQVEGVCVGAGVEGEQEGTGSIGKVTTGRLSMHGVMPRYVTACWGDGHYGKPLRSGCCAALCCAALIALAVVACSRLDVMF